MLGKAPKNIPKWTDDMCLTDSIQNFWSTKQTLVADTSPGH